MKRAVAKHVLITTIILSCLVSPQTFAHDVGQLYEEDDLVFDLQEIATEQGHADEDALTKSKLKVVDNLLVREQVSSGYESIYGDLTVGHNVTIGGTLTTQAVTSDATITSTSISVINANISGTVTVNNVNVTGATTITGTTNFNTVGSAPTFIGNATGGIFFPTDLAAMQQGDSFLVINPSTGEVRLDGDLSLVGAIINGGQPGPLVIGTSNDTSMSFVTSGSNVVRLSIDNNGAVFIAEPEAGIALTVTGNSSNPAMVVTGNSSITAPALQVIGSPAAYGGNYVLQIDPDTGVVTQGLVMTTSGGGGINTLQADTGAASGSTVNLLGGNSITTAGDDVATVTISLINNPIVMGNLLVTGTLTTESVQATYATIGTSTITNLTATLAQIGTLNVTTAATVTGATNINTTGSATTSIGTGSGAVMVGNSASTLTIAGSPANINTAAAAVTTIGTSGGTNTMTGPTHMTGATNINTGSATTNTTIGNAQSATTITGTTMITGDTVIEASSGIPLSVTGNTSNPTLVATGSSSTTAPALRLLDNPTSATTDYLLTIDSSGNVKQSSGTEMVGNIILNGGQTGPVTIGTTNDTSMSFIADNATVLTMAANGQIGIGTTAPYEQVVIAGSVPTAAVGSIGLPPESLSIYVQGRYAYLAGYGTGKFQVIDVSNPASPVSVATVSTSDGLNSVYVQGHYAYVVNVISNTLQIFDVSNPASPVSVSSIATGSYPYSVYVQGRYAYVVTGEASTLQIIDVSNPTNPTVVGSVDTDTGPYAVYVQGRYAYAVNTGFGTLQIIDVSNPVNPTVVGSVSAGGNSGQQGIYVQGRYAYVTNANSNTLQILDVSKPTNPTSAGNIATSSRPYSVYVQGRYAYVACQNQSGTDEFQIFNVSNPASPVAVGSVVVGDNSYAAYMQGRYAYVVNAGIDAGAGTLQIFDVGGAYIQQLEAGGIEVGTLQTRENMTVNNDFDVRGGAVFGQGFQVTGASSIITTTNATVPALTVTGYSSQSAPALQLVGSPASGVSDYLLTINPTTGVVGQSPIIVDILNGGQTGPLTIGTTNYTNMSFITDNATVLTMSATGQIGIGTTAPYEQVVIAGSVPTAAVGSATTGTGPNCVFVQGRYAYVINKDSGTLQIFDVSNPNPEIVGAVTVGTTPTKVYVQGRYAYVADTGAGDLYIIDVSNPAGPVIVGLMSTGSTSVYVQGRYAYVTNLTATLGIIDVSNPASPISVGTVATGSNPQFVYVQGRYAYVINEGASTLQIIDVNNPANPLSVATVSTGSGGDPACVYVQGRYAYVVNSGTNTLQIFDVSSPTSPASVGTLSTGSDSNPISVYVQGRYAYVVNSGTSTLQFIDVSNPASPVSIGSVETGTDSFPDSVYVQGRYAYVVNFDTNTLQIFDVGGAYIQQLEAGGIEVGTLQTRENMTVNNDLDVKGGAVFGQGFQATGASSIMPATNATVPALTVTGYNSVAAPALQLLDNPASATTDYLLTINSSGNVTQSSGTEMIGNLLVNGGQAGPLAIGTTNDTNMSFIVDNATVITMSASGQIGIGTTAPYEQVVIAGSVPTAAVGSIATGTDPESVYVQGRYAYVTNSSSNTLQIIDVSNSASPTVVGSVATGTAPTSVYVQGRYAYVANTTSGTLQIIDVSNPASPVIIGAANITGAYKVYVQGRYAYVISAANSLQIIDVSNPASPISVASITIDEVTAVYVQGRYAYVVNRSSNSLQIIDVSNPANPTSVGTASVGEVPVSVYVQGRYAYVANSTSNTLQIIDVSNPASPVSVGSVGTGVAPYSVYVQGRYAYVVNAAFAENGTLQIIDVSNPASPFTVGSVSTGVIGEPESVYVQGRYAYVVNYNSSTLQIFDVGGAYIQQLEAGGIEVGTLQTRENMTVNNDFDVRGGAIFGQGFQTTGASSITTITGTNGNQTVPALTLTGTSISVSSTPLNLQGLYSQAAINVLNVDASGNVFLATSTKKYKQNIRTMDTESELLYQLRPVIYDPLEGRGTVTNIPGFIAEEVYEASQNPALVCFDNEGVITNVNYIPLNALEINELQKHQQRLDEQEKQHQQAVAALRAEIAQLVAACSALSGSGALNIDIKK